jgi:hypothetical protein
MSITELRLMIDAVNPSIGFTMLPTLVDGSGWVLTAFTDCVNIVQIRYYHVPVVADANFVVTSEARRSEWFMDDATEVVNKVVDLLTTHTLS